jgi:hypothetical protein
MTRDPALPHHDLTLDEVEALFDLPIAIVCAVAAYRSWADSPASTPSPPLSIRHACAQQALDGASASDAQA